MHGAWVLLILTLAVQLIPEMAAAFAASPRFYQGCTGISSASSLHFPGIPLTEGIRHIHTLEHLENITHDKTPAFFHIQHVAQPQTYGDHVSVCVRCTIKGYPQTIYMLARPQAPDTCTFMCVRDGVQRATIQLRATRMHQGEGHRLHMSCTYLTAPRSFDRDMEPVMRFLRFFEKRMRWQTPAVQSDKKTHGNLQWYRHRVLGLESHGI